jgi:pimeloyl-ACP methyl ester carboxylesterase
MMDLTHNQPLYDFGGSGPVMHLALANGFPPLTYAPLMQPFTDRYHVVSLPPRPLWNQPPETSSAPTWETLGSDLLAGFDAYSLDPIIGVGHSFGSIATIKAAIAQPQRFRALVLLDPTMLAPAIMQMINDARAIGQDHRMPMVEGALRRRSRFASRDEAFAYWREKPLFSDWSDDALWLYVDSLTRPAADGEGLELSWSAEWEAHYYRTIDTTIWDELARISPALPVLAIRGTTTNTFTADSADAFRIALPQADLIEIEGHGHLFPHSAPTQTRTLMQEWLSAHGL